MLWHGAAALARQINELARDCFHFVSGRQIIFFLFFTGEETREQFIETKWFNAHIYNLFTKTAGISFSLMVKYTGQIELKKIINKI